MNLRYADREGHKGRLAWPDYEDRKEQRACQDHEACVVQLGLLDLPRKFRQWRTSSTTSSNNCPQP